MTEIIYKTRPKLFILLTPILGAVFFCFLCWLTLKSGKSEFGVIPILLLTLFVSISGISLFYALNIKTVKLTTENIVISHLLLPTRKTINFADIVSISQKTKDVYAILGNSFIYSFLYTDSITTFNFKNDKEIRLRSIGKLDFDEFNKAYRKTKNKEGKIKQNRQSNFEYIADNLDGIFWGALALILTIGLSHELLTK